MKIYIVTSGEYSDYSICRVFLKRENADRYAELYNDWYTGATVEEYGVDDASDGFEIKSIRYVDMDYTEYENGEREIEFRIRTTNSLDNPNGMNRTQYAEQPGYALLRYGPKSPSRSLYLYREIDDNHDEDYYRDKYTKVCEDLMTKAKYYCTVDGMTEQQVCDALANVKCGGDGK